jgi:soluble lytic murein transglycosylase-like protein
MLLLGALMCPASSIPAAAGEPLSLEQAELTLRALPLPPAVQGLVGFPEFSRGRKAFLALLAREAHQRRLPPELADAVTQIESGYDPSARGSAGEIGLMQVMPGTAAMLGFLGTDAELAVPETNIRLGVTYLAEAWRLAGGNLCRALMKYRAGHGEEVMSARSVEYCLKART